MAPDTAGSQPAPTGYTNQLIRLSPTWSIKEGTSNSWPPGPNFVSLHSASGAYILPGCGHVPSSFRSAARRAAVASHDLGVEIGWR